MNPVSVQQKRLSEQLLLMTPSHRQNPFSLKLGLLKLDDIFMLQLTSFVYAYINKLAPPVFDNYFNYISNIHDHSTGQAARGTVVPDLMEISHFLSYLSDSKDQTIIEKVLLANDRGN